MPTPPWTPPLPTAVLVLADGTVIEGTGCGATGEAVGEVCFNTAMTGYQEILTDPSYADQIITFTFPHIGNVGVNAEDDETSNPDAAAKVRGCVLHEPVTGPSNWRAEGPFDDWLKQKGIIGICGVDTRALTARIREHGMPNAVIAHHPDGDFDIAALKEKAAQWPGITGADLAARVSTRRPYEWTEGSWRWPDGFAKPAEERFHVVAVDYGLKRNILRCLADVGCRVTVVPADATAEDILALNPDGVFLANGPGDPAATGEYAAPQIARLASSGTPLFGICLGHQLLAIALGGGTKKMKQGHHGANHPVKDFTTRKVEITSMNHGFTVDAASLPDGVEETHVSLFDGTNCGLAMTGKPVFSVQHHPEASPGPQDSHYLFRRFAALMAGH
ncbi:MAG TPA: carbamoyl-phosphate synthase small subunit [Thermopetrobacter sp.]|nr:carbamoyl-phosphate synthase small subunit [Thermopetrobacter sp.]